MITPPSGTVNYLKTSGEDWILNAPVDLLNYYIYGKRTHDRRQIVVLTKVLADEINVGYNDLKDRVISHVNGKKISDMKDLVNAFENNQGKYHIIVDERGDNFVLEKQKVDEYGPNILANYSITSDRSGDLEQAPATMQGLLLDSTKVIKNGRTVSGEE